MEQRTNIDDRPRQNNLYLKQTEVTRATETNCSNNISAN